MKQKILMRSDYNYFNTASTRWRDMDTLGHINHTVYFWRNAGSFCYCWTSKIRPFFWKYCLGQFIFFGSIRLYLLSNWYTPFLASRSSKVTPFSSYFRGDEKYFNLWYHKLFSDIKSCFHIICIFCIWNNYFLPIL